MRQNKWLLGGAIVVAVAALAVFALKPWGSGTTTRTASTASSGSATGSASGRPVLYEFYTDW